MAKVCLRPSPFPDWKMFKNAFTFLCRSVREGLADVWRQASGEEEDPHLQVQPQSHLQRHLRV